MKRIRRHIASAALILLMTILASCRQELCFDHFPGINMMLDWEYEWERDYGRNHASNWDASFYGFEYSTLLPTTPEWVSFVKFRKDGSSEESFMSVNGSRVNIDNNIDDSFLFYNGDTEYIVLQDIASVNDARATTSSRSRSRSSLKYLMSLAPNTRSVNPPDLLYGAYVDNLPTVHAHETYPMPVKMQPLVYTYIIRYEFEYGLEHVALSRGAMGGMAESVYLRTGATSDETAIILYDCELTDYGCEARVKSFGVPSFPDKYYGDTRGPEDAVPVAVNLELRLTSGKYIDFNFDVSDQIVNQPRGGVITIKGIRVEDDDNKSEGGGFDVDLSGWGDPIEQELPL